MKDINAFISGRKPAFLCSHRYESDALEQLKSYNFPSLIYYELEDFDESGTIFDRGTLFFQNNRLKNEYLEAAESIKDNKREEIILLGKTLGYPPKAVAYYAELNDDSAPRVEMSWDGCVCVGSIYDIGANVLWLWKNYPAASFVNDVELTYRPTENQRITRFIKYKDYDALRRIADELINI